MKKGSSIPVHDDHGKISHRTLLGSEWECSSKTPSRLGVCSRQILRLPFLLPQFQLFKNRVEPVKQAYHKAMKTITVATLSDIEPVKIMEQPIEKLEPIEGIQ